MASFSKYNIYLVPYNTADSGAVWEVWSGKVMIIFIKMEQEYILASKRNLTKLLDKIKKHKQVYNEFEVKLAMKGLCVYHCVRQTNIAQVIKDGEIRIKNEILRAEMTNNQSDYFQGFDSHLSMSIGKPWSEYGPYSFVFGLEDLSKEALFFFKDPWQFGNKHMEHNFLIKEDFEEFARELLSRNLLFINKNLIIKKPYKGDIHGLAKFNFRKFEVKQPENIKIEKATEFLVWSHFDYFLEVFVRILFRWYFLLAFVMLIVIKGLQL